MLTPRDDAIESESHSTFSEDTADWDVMGDDEADAKAAVHVPEQDFKASLQMVPAVHIAAISAAAGCGHRRSYPSMDRVPMFETGEPQYTFGDGGGPPESDDTRYLTVLDLTPASSNCHEIEAQMSGCSF
jgi:hypothetical protein